MLPRPANYSSKYRRRNPLRNLNFNLALLQLFYLTISPRRFYRQLYYHKQTTNKWSRSDPTISIIVAGFLFISALGWSLSFKLGFSGWLKLGIKMLIPSARVEWAYAFDVHTNGYFPIILLLYLLQLFLWPLLTRQEWICTFIGNTIYLVSFLHYIHITYLGYAALPFVIKSELLLTSAPLILIVYLVTLIGFNVPKATLEWYFNTSI
ncbi:UNC-50-like protein [Wallemia mellicola]|nr:UNC-50-like protein [Wallemia mellicola]TIC58227.1 UNC-50-like protein [Wallemia mellicola]